MNSLQVRTHISEDPGVPFPSRSCWGCNRWIWKKNQRLQLMSLRYSLSKLFYKYCTNIVQLLKNRYHGNLMKPRKRTLWLSFDKIQLRIYSRQSNIISCNGRHFIIILLRFHAYVRCSNMQNEYQYECVIFVNIICQYHLCVHWLLCIHRVHISKVT